MSFRISPKTILNFSIVLFIVSAGFLLLPKPAQAAITYNPSQNRITVTEGTEASPNTFTGIYNADKAGTLDLITRTGINGVDGSPVNNIYNLRPADEKLLGGAKHDLYITITNWDATTATIQLVGTDENGGALTEDIVVTANGTYNATQLFKTLTQTQVTVFDGTIFDYKLTQGQWGAVWKTDKGFFISSHLHIGNGATVTYLTTFGGEQIQVGAEASADRRAICLTTNAHFWMGKLDTEGYGYDGSNLLWYCYYSHAEQGQGGYNMWKGDFRIYGSTLVRYTYQAGYAATTFSGQVQMIDSALQSLGNRGTWYFPSSGTGTIRRSILDCNYYIYIYTTGLTIDRLYLTKYNTGILSGGSATISNVDYGTAKKHQNYYNAQTNLIDSTILNENVLPSASGYNGVVNKKFHLDLKVIDKDNNPINGASVKIWNNEGALVADTTTNANGIIPQQLLTPVYFHYVLPQSGGTWTTTNDNPFKIRISSQNYPSREFKFTLDKKMDLTLALKDKPLSEGTVKVLGTEYESSDATAAVYAQILNGDGSPGTSATVTLTVYDRDGNVVTGFDGVSMTHIANGIYRYSMTTPAAEGTYAASVVASNPTAYGVGDFHIASWANKIASKADIASEVEATLSASHGIGSWLGTSPADVWAYESRTLSGFGTLVADVWKNTDNIGSTLATNLGKAIWEYSTRTLSNFGTLAADIWSNASRTLSSALLGSGGELATKTTVETATSSAVTSIKGTSGKDLTDISGEIAGVQTTVTSIESKVDSLHTKVNTVDANVDTIVSKWGSYSASDIIGYVDEIESRLGDNADTCVLDDTVFGNIQCIRDKWGDTQTADTIYTAANNAYDTTVLVRAELAYSGKSTTAYDDIQSLKGYVDTLESSIGSSSDTSSNNTVFGKIKGVQDSVDQLTTIDTNIDTLVSKWGSYSASDIYDKVKNLSSDISAINTVSNVSSILSLAQTDADNMTDLKNKVLGMKAVVDVNRMLLDGLAHQPVIKTWLEEGSVIFKTLITNPSQLYTQTVPLKYYLPREAKKEDIIKMNEGLSVEYDVSREAYYVSGEFKLKPGETKTFSVEVADVWQIPEEEITSLKNQADELFEPLKKTSYFAQGSTLKNDIYASLDKAESLMKNAYTPEARIRAYREAMIEIESAKRKLEDMKTLVSSAGSIGTMFGFMGGVSTVGTFGIITVVIVGIAFLGLLFRQLFTGKTIKVTAEDGKKQELARINFWEKMKNGFNKTGNGLKNGARKIKNGVLGKKAKLGIIIFLVAGGVILGANLFRGGEGKQEQKEVSPSPTPTLEPMSTEKKVKVLNTEVNYLNVREGPGSEYKKITRVDVSEEFIELERKENSIGEEWVKISLEGVEGLPSEALAKEGWVLGKYVENVGEKILGAVAGQKVMVVVPAGASGVNIREKPSLDSKILARFWVSKKVNRLDEINGWVKIEIEVEKDGIKYSEGWVSKQLIEKIEE